MTKVIRAILDRIRQFGLAFGEFVTERADLTSLIIVVVVPTLFWWIVLT
jgi:hypothetical protein